ncbi:hypothetical protein ABKN59_006993 [Abortiporus biennis]
MNSDDDLPLNLLPSFVSRSPEKTPKSSRRKTRYILDCVLLPLPTKKPPPQSRMQDTTQPVKRGRGRPRKVKNIAPSLAAGPFRQPDTEEDPISDNYGRSLVDVYNIAHRTRSQSRHAASIASSRAPSQSNRSVASPLDDDFQEDASFTNLRNSTPPPEASTSKLRSPQLRQKRKRQSQPIVMEGTIGDFIMPLRRSSSPAQPTSVSAPAPKKRRIGSGRSSAYLAQSDLSDTESERIHSTSTRAPRTPSTKSKKRQNVVDSDYERGMSDDPLTENQYEEYEVPLRPSSPWVRTTYATSRRTVLVEKPSASSRSMTKYVPTPSSRTSRSRTPSRRNTPSRANSVSAPPASTSISASDPKTVAEPKKRGRPRSVSKPRKAKTAEVEAPSARNLSPTPPPIPVVSAPKPQPKPRRRGPPGIRADTTDAPSTSRPVVQPRQGKAKATPTVVGNGAPPRTSIVGTRIPLHSPSPKQSSLSVPKARPINKESKKPPVNVRNSLKRPDVSVEEDHPVMDGDLHPPSPPRSPSPIPQLDLPSEVPERAPATHAASEPSPVAESSVAPKPGTKAKDKGKQVQNKVPSTRVPPPAPSPHKVVPSLPSPSPNPSPPATPKPPIAPPVQTESEIPDIEMVHGMESDVPQPAPFPSEPSQPEVIPPDSAQLVDQQEQIPSLSLLGDSTSSRSTSILLEETRLMLSNLMDEIGSLRTSLSAKESQITNLQSELSSCQSYIRTQDNTMESFKHHISSISEEVKKEREEMRKDLQKVLMVEKERVEREQKRAEEERDRVEREKEHLEKEMAHVEREKKHLAAEMERLEEEKANERERERKEAKTKETDTESGQQRDSESPGSKERSLSVENGQSDDITRIVSRLNDKLVSRIEICESQSRIQADVLRSLQQKFDRLKEEVEKNRKEWIERQMNQYLTFQKDVDIVKAQQDSIVDKNTSTFRSVEESIGALHGGQGQMLQESGRIKDELAQLRTEFVQLLQRNPESTMGGTSATTVHDPSSDLESRLKSQFEELFRSRYDLEFRQMCTSRNGTLYEELKRLVMGLMSEVDRSAEEQEQNDVELSVSDEASAISSEVHAEPVVTSFSRLDPEDEHGGEGYGHSMALITSNDAAQHMQGSVDS